MNGFGVEEDAAILNEVREWKREWTSRGASFRPRLEAYRARLLGDLKLVEQTLREIGEDLSASVVGDGTLGAPAGGLAASSDPDKSPWPDLLRQQNPSDTDLVLAVLDHEGKWTGSQRVLEVGRAINPNLTSERVHSTLYRLSTSKRILAKGTRGSKMYARLGLEEESPSLL